MLTGSQKIMQMMHQSSISLRPVVMGGQQPLQRPRHHREAETGWRKRTPMAGSPIDADAGL